MIPTPHIELEDKNLIAKTVLMPGDPLRAKFIAENFLTDVVQINKVRNMLGYTGYFKGKKVSIIGSGMGLPSIGIYSYELFKFYDVDSIIRVGSAGAYTDELNLFDIVLAKASYSESTYAKTMGVSNNKIMKASNNLLVKLKDAADSLKINVRSEIIHSSDVFYRLNPNKFIEIHKKHGCVCIENESFALFANAKALGKSAATILTISDSLITHKKTSPQERQEAFKDMILIALESI